MPPLWSLGYHQSKWSYFPESKVWEIAYEFRNRKIPCDVIHLDIDYMEGFRCFTWDLERFPNPKKMISELKQKAGFETVIIIDPGIGFGKSTGQALAIINHADKFSELGVRVLVGHSRKLFMANLSHVPAPERDLETLIMTMRLAEQAVGYIRVHNVEMSARALRIAAIF